MPQLVERRFRAFLEFNEGISMELDSIEEFLWYLPSNTEYIDKRNTDEIARRMYFIQQGGVIRAILPIYILEYCIEPRYGIYTELHAIDINTEEEIIYPLDKGEVLISDVRDFLPETISSDLIYEIESYLLRRGEYYQLSPGLKVELIPDIDCLIRDSLIPDSYNYFIFNKEILIDNYCDSVINEHKDYLISTFPSIIEAYELYKEELKRVKLKIETRTIDELIFICKAFITIEGNKEVPPFSYQIQDNRLEFLSKGPYYHEDSRLIWQCNISSIYSLVELQDNIINLITVIDYEDEEQQYSWYSNSNNLPPLVESNIYLLFKANRTKEETLQAYRYPYSNKVEATPDYPFKYIYPTDESISS